MDPFHGYKNAIDDQLDDAVAVLDAFHVVKLGCQAVDEVRRRVQQDILGHRGRKDDPLYEIRSLLRRGAEQLTERQQARLATAIEAGDPHVEVIVAWQCYQQLRHLPRRPPAKGRQIAIKVFDSFPPARSPRSPGSAAPWRWRQQFLAYFDTHGVTNGGTEAICECGGWLVWDWLVRMVPVALPGV